MHKSRTNLTWQKRTSVSFEPKPGTSVHGDQITLHIIELANGNKAPSTRMQIFLKQIFFPILPSRPHANGVSRTLSRVKMFENAVFVFTCGRAKTKVFCFVYVFKMMDQKCIAILFGLIHVQ